MRTLLTVKAKTILVQMKKFFSFLVFFALCAAGYWGWKATHPSPEQLVAEFQKLWIHSQAVGDQDGNALMADSNKMQPLTDRLIAYGPAGDRAAEKGALDPNQGKREASIFLLGILKDKHAVPLLSTYAASGTNDDRYAAPTVLSWFHPPYGRDAFLAVVKQPESFTTHDAIDGLTPFQNPEWVPLIIPLLRGRYFETRSSAIGFLGNCGGKPAYQALLTRRKEFEHLKPKKGEWSFHAEIKYLDKNIRSARNNQSGFQVGSGS